MEAIGIIGVAGQNFASSYAADQIAGIGPVVLLPRPRMSGSVNPEHRLRHGFWCRIHTRSAKSLGLPPFLPGPGSLGRIADNSRIDRQPLDIGIMRHSLEYPVDHTFLDPAIIATLGGLIRTKFPKKITLTSTRSLQPQQRTEKSPT